MSAFVGRNPLPPIPGTNDVLAWDGTEFRPTRAANINPVFASISAAALALAIGTGISDANAIGFLPNTATPGSESLTMYVGGVAGPVWTRSSSVVNLDLQGGTFKSSAYTSTRVPFFGASGLMTDSAGLTYSSNLLVIGDQSTTATLRIDGAAGSTKMVVYRTAGSNRWFAGSSSAAEGGSNAGSAYIIQAFDDSGTVIDTPFTITRASGGAVLIARPIQTGSGSAGAPSYAFSTDTTSGIYRQASGVLGLVAAGVEYLRIGATQFIYSRNTSVTLGTSPITGVGTITVHAVDAAASTIALCAYANQPGITFRRANGTAASLTATALNDSLAVVNNQGYNTTTSPGFTAARLAWVIGASENYTDVAQGFYQDFYTVATGAATAGTRRVRFDASGSVLIGTVTDGMTAGGSLAVAQDFAHRGTNLGVFNTSPIAKKTGYGTPTGGSLVSSYPGATATLAQTSGTLAQLLLDLKAYGLLGV